MKKISVALMFLCSIGLSVFAQSPQNPPLRRTTPTPTPQTDAPTQPNTTRRPPVLSGNTNPTPAAQPGKTPEETVGDDEVIRVETNLVTMPVSVLDRNGRFVAGLRQKDFHIFEDGVEQKIDHFTSVEQPFTVVLLIDVSPSTQYQINEIQDSAIAFVNQLRRDDRVIVMSFNDKVRVLSPATSDRAVLRDAILQTSFGDGTSLYDAVDQAINQQLRNIQGRKAIVLFSDGVDTTSRRSSYVDTIRQVEELDALVYTIRYDTFNDMTGGGNTGPVYSPSPRSGGGLGGIIGIILGGGNVQIGGGGRGGGSSGSTRAAYETGRRYMDELSRNSGGRTFEAQTTYNLESAFSGIAEELRRQYSVGYYPENVGEVGQRKQIKIRVDRPNAVVKAKNTYVVGASSAANAARQQPAQQQRPTLQRRTTGRLPF